MHGNHARRLLGPLALTALTLAAPGMAQGTAGPIYVADPGNGRIVRMDDLTGSGWTVVSQNLAGTDRFGSPYGIALGPDGKIYVTDRHRIVRMDDIAGNGWISFGSTGAGTNQFGGLGGIYVDVRNRIYVADSANHRIVAIDDMTGAGWQTCCSAPHALGLVESVSVDDTTGQIYATDLNNDRVVRVDTMAGANFKSLGSFGSGTGQFQSPRGLFVRAGKVYVVDENNKRIVQTNDTLDGSGWTVVTTNAAGTESFDGPRYVFVDSAGKLYLTDYRANRIIGLDGIDGATWTALGTVGSGVKQFQNPEGIVLGTTTTSSTRADVSLTLQVDQESADAGQPLTYTLAVSNQGPDRALAVSVVDLLPTGASYLDSSGGTVSTDRVTWSLGDLSANGSSGGLSLRIATPTVVDCKQPIVDVAATSSTTTDPNPANNFATVVVRPLPAQSEDCAGTVDADCNGLTGCADPSCAAACATTPVTGIEISGGGSVPGPGLPSVAPRDMSQPPPPPARPLPDPDRTPPTTPAEEPPCARADTRAPLPSYCCDPLPPPPGSTSPSEADWNTNCHAVDPNFLQAEPAVNAMGYGLTIAGGTINYTIHYENIGGADAHGVGIISVLDPDLDAQTLAIGSGGTFARSTGTINWLDPVLPPHVPRTVTFSAKVRADAPPRTRVRAQATVVFPDAFPPSRTDSNSVVHVVPYPDHPLEPALAIYKCVPVAGSSDQWTAIIENRGFGFAYDVRANIKSAPSAVTITQGTTSFADVRDPTPDKLASVVPLASTASRTPVSFTSPKSPDPCAVMTWELSYSTSAGQRVVVDVQAAADVDGDGIPDYLGAGDAGVGGKASSGGGCGCAATGANSAVAPALLALAVLVQLGRRRRSP